MTSFPFDTHRAVKELEKAGFSEAQAEAVVETLGIAIGGNLATKADFDLLMTGLNGVKSDLVELNNKTDRLAESMRAETDALKEDNASIRAEMHTENASLRSEIKAGNASIRSELQAESASTRSEMQAGNASLRSEMQALELRMTIRLGAIAVATVAVAVAKFL